MKMKVGRKFIFVGVLVVMLLALFMLSSALRSRFRPKPRKQLPIEEFKDSVANIPQEANEDNPTFFLPGSLNLTKWETVNQCFVDPQVYAEHLPSNAYCVISSKNKLIYYLIPKSGSSTNREVMTSSLQGRETTTEECDKLAKLGLGYRTIGFVRDPANRIYSSYEEAIARKLNDVKSIPEHLRRFVDGLPNYKAYEKLFTKPETLTRRFEQFLQDWDGKELFDNHLSLQVPLMAHKATGLTRSFVWLGEVSKLDEDWKMASSLLNFPSPIVIHGRSFPRRMNISAVTPHAKRRICKLLALDFCCLNFAFPPECIQGGDTLGCAWRDFPEFGKKLIVPVGGP